MMMLLLRKKLLASTSCKFPFLLLPRCLSSSSSSPDLQPHFKEGFLINSCGLSPEKAAKAAKRLPHIKTLQGPDSVISFLKHWGFDDAHIRRLVSTHPALLGYNVEKPLEPNIRTVLDIGFSLPELPSILIRNPKLLILGDVGQRIQFWRTLLDNDDRKLRLALKTNRNLISSDTARSITPKITLLKTHGLSDPQIQKLLLLGGSLFACTTNLIESLLEWTKDLGFQVDSTMFVNYLYALFTNGRPLFKAKMELFNNYNLSEQEFLSAFKRYPMLTYLSQDSIRAKMEFLVSGAGCSPSYIALHPYILGYSLHKRLMPRNYIKQVLEAKEVANFNLHSIIQISDKIFVHKCIHQFKDKVPELQEIYSDACTGRYSKDKDDNPGATVKVAVL